MTDKPHMTLPNGDVIYEGDYGLTRDWRIVGPMVRWSEKSMHPWEVIAHTDDLIGEIWGNDLG